MLTFVVCIFLCIPILTSAVLIYLPLQSTNQDYGERRQSSRLKAKSTPSDKAAPHSRNSVAKKSNKGKSSMSTAADKVCQHFFFWFVYILN